MRLLVACVLLPILATVAQAADLDVTLVALRQVHTNRANLVPAARTLAGVCDELEARNDFHGFVEARSALYWARKQMTATEVVIFAKDGVAFQRSELIMKYALIGGGPKGQLEYADKAATTTKDTFVIATRYYEIASRYPDTPEGKIALDKSVKAMQAVTGQATGAKAPSLPKQNGRVYVTSDPPGAAVYIMSPSGDVDTGQKTPATITAPWGYAFLVIRKDGFADAKVTASITDAIEKIPTVKLNKPKVNVDVLFEGNDGFEVYVDGKPATDKRGGGPAVAPCTIALEKGTRTFTFVKDGFMDTEKSVEVKEGTTVEVKGVKPKAGKSKIITWPADAVAFRGHHYKFVEQRVKWPDAAKACRDMGGHLASVHSQEENEFLADLTKGKIVFIGGSLEKGTWKWDDGTPFNFTAWSPGEPNGAETGETVLLSNWLYSRGGWNDASPEWLDDGDLHLSGFICEWEPLGIPDMKPQEKKIQLITDPIVGKWQWQWGDGGQTLVKEFGADGSVKNTTGDASLGTWVKTADGYAITYVGFADTIKLTGQDTLTGISVSKGGTVQITLWANRVK